MYGVLLLVGHVVLRTKEEVSLSQAYRTPPNDATGSFLFLQKNTPVIPRHEENCLLWAQESRNTNVSLTTSSNNYFMKIWGRSGGHKHALPFYTMCLCDIALLT